MSDVSTRVGVSLGSSEDAWPTNCRVLVVDDNNASALTLSWGLELLGFEVKTCNDGASALDITMPGMNGYEVCRRLRQNAALKTAKIIAQTVWNQIEFRRRAKEVGFDHYLVKPISLGGLHKAIAGLLARDM